MGRAGPWRSAGGRWSWRRGRGAALLAAAAAALLVRPGLLPDLPGRPGSLIEAFLPWLGLAVPPLAGWAVLRRSRTALCAAALPVLAWTAAFGAFLLPRAEQPADLRAVQHNVADDNTDPAGTALALARTGADLIAVEELTPAAAPAFTAALGADYTHHAAAGTVALWSRHPLADPRPVDIRPAGVGEGWNRGLRATARTPHGDIAVYVAHLPSVRVGPLHGFDAARRDESAVLLGRALAAEPMDRVVLLGDLNATVDDRGIAPVVRRTGRPARDFAFSWPAALPAARIDHVLARGAEVTRLRTLPPTGSDHLPVAARIRF
ncbi:endonuclease/exonuclease/phosphatase family protein [Streptomyces globosus]|uniref:endonuclease/exonuclease/phosphatase family protein n=1 Tax=Streptomyces globosus TaxID=68209 RepID=UPI00382BB233